jgi:hypothetical protein
VTRRATLWVSAVALVVALAALWHWRSLHEAHATGVLIAGGDGGGLPRTAPELEGFDAAALNAAAAEAIKRGASALLIMRHGHLIYEAYAGRTDASTRVPGGELARSLLVMAAGIAVAQHGMIMPAPPLSSDRLEAAIAAAGGRSYPAFLSRHVWQPLHAAPAYWSPPEVSARSTDWLRVGELLLHDGRFEGTQIVPPGWIARYSPALFGRDVGFPAATGLASLRGPGSTRLWLAPRTDLAILRVAAAPPPGVAVDEALARTIINTLREHPSTGGSSLNDLVPGH